MINIYILICWPCVALESEVRSQRGREREKKRLLLTRRLKHGRQRDEEWNKDMFIENGELRERARKGNTAGEWARKQRNPCWKSLVSGRGVETGVLSGREKSASLPHSCTQAHEHRNTHSSSGSAEQKHRFYVTQQRQEVYWLIRHFCRFRTKEKNNKKTLAHNGASRKFQRQSDHRGRSDCVHTPESRLWPS